MNGPKIAREVGQQQQRVPLDGLFMLSTAGVLATTRIAKVWTSLGNVKLLGVADPVLGIKFAHLMLAAGMAEIVIAPVCLFSRRSLLPAALVAWPATVFVIYRFGSWWMDWRHPCGCLGNLTDVLHIAPRTPDILMKVVLACLLIGSYAILLWEWRRGRGALRPVLLKPRREAPS